MPFKDPQSARAKESSRLRGQRWREKNPERAKEVSRANYARHREAKQAAGRAWHQAHRGERAVQMRAWTLKTAYGLTPEQYAALGSACGICGVTEDRRNNRTYEFSVDHDAVTKRIRGLLCGNCNAGIGLLKHDVEILRKAIAYLERTG